MCRPTRSRCRWGETVSRTITQFKTTGVISLQPQGRVVLRDRLALEECAEGA